MAWRSSGTTNDEMVDKLKRFLVITSDEVESAFRNVDRKFFVPKSSEDVAHRDQPFKEGNIHISAPHIYGSVIEALDLKNGAYSFLNAGSGTGYLTCIAASIMGPRAMNYCVEIHDDVIVHSNKAIAAWKENLPVDCQTPNIKIIHGNALELNTNTGECAVGFNRIYIGAAIEEHHLPQFKKMLKPGGILVGPVGDELVKIVRSQNFKAGNDEQVFTTQIISGVRFAPLLENPTIQTIIPACVWDPSNHHLYPESFRGACNEILMCSNAKRKQPITPIPQQNINVASMLPRILWVEILSFTTRDWFDAPINEVEYLRKRLAEEQANLEIANQARQEAESAARLALRERDMYRILARTLRARLTSNNLEENNGTEESIEETAAAMLFEDTFDISHILQRFRVPVALAVTQDRSDEDMGQEEDEAYENSEDEDGSSEEDDNMGDTDDEEEDESDDDDESL